MVSFQSKFINKHNWRIIRFYIIGWTLAFVFLAIVRGVGTEEVGQLKFDFKSSIIIGLTMGPILGIISGIASIWAEKNVYRKLSIAKLLLLRTLYAMLFIISMAFVAYWVYQFYFGTEISFRTFALDAGSGAIYFYIWVTDFFLTILRQVNLMLGEGNLLKLIRGKFYTPREEVRIFMFLDLQSSTELAERLGHVNYSLLIQDCFNDLGVVIENEAEIYQYVGDEAVLTWNLPDGIRKENCIRAYYNFSKILHQRSGYYMERYDCVPFFKAGLHAGLVTVTEVGKYKKEIAYHGDTLNTAARIQGQCNVLQSELLISENLKNLLPPKTFSFIPKGTISLKGKKEKVDVHSLENSA